MKEFTDGKLMSREYTEAEIAAGKKLSEKIYEIIPDAPGHCLHTTAVLRDGSFRCNFCGVELDPGDYMEDES